jgi:hypothetical protein
VARLYPSNGEADSRPAVRVTIHGRVWSGVLHARAWSEDHGEWRCTVEIWVDDRAVRTSVPADQVELVDRP